MTMKTKLISLCMMLAVLFTTLMPIGVSAADFPANPITKAGYTLDFQEEFNNTTLDTNKWLPYYLPHWTTPADRELGAKARYTIANGFLQERIDADTPAWNPTYDSTVKISSIQTYEKDYWHKFNGSMPNNHHEADFNGYSTMYGYFEMRAKNANVGGGGHQAWWMVGTQDTSSASANSEIDIVETFFSKPDTWRINGYGWGDPTFLDHWEGFEDPVPYGDQSSEYHIYGMEWSPTQLKFYYDNVLYKTINDAPNMSMGMILGIYTDAGSGVHNNVWPKTWSVDYIRVWKPNGGYPTPYYRIKNHQTGLYMHTDSLTGKIEYGNVPATDYSSQWSKETTDGYTRYKNRSTGQYMHLENLNGSIQYGTMPATYWSSQWTEEAVSGYTRIKNRWNSTYMHTENYTGFVQYGSVPTTYWTSQWTFEPVN